MSRWSLVAMLVVTTPACAASHPRQGTRSPPASVAPDRGSPALVHTTSRVLDGVRIVVPCRDPGAVGVIGLGHVEPPTADAATFHNWLDVLDQHVRRTLGAHVAGVGWGEACKVGDVGARVYVDHYGRFDDVVAGLAALVQQQRLRLHFVVVLQIDARPL